MGITARTFIDFCRKLFSDARLEIKPGAHSVAMQSSLHRRKNTRVNYSHIGAVGHMPRIFRNDQELRIGNISVGGLLIHDTNESLGDEVGHVIELTLSWDDLDTQVKSRIVAAQLGRRHIQFIDFDPAPFIRISRLIQPGFLGSKFYQVQDHEQMLEVSELWVGPSGESLQFPREITGSCTAKIVINNKTIIVHNTKPPYWENSGLPINKDLLSHLLVIFSNFQQNSVRVRTLIETLNQHFNMAPSADPNAYDVA